MDLWIRSQNKKSLIKADRVSVVPDAKSGGYKVINPYGTAAWYELGNYSTEEKALKVLDDIQQYITGYFSSNINRTYSIPKDEEV